MKNKMIISLLFLCSFVFAQEIKTLSLKEALQYALENKAEAKKAKLQTENSEYKIQEVRSRALPQIAANGSLNYNPILQTTVIDGTNFGAPGTTIQAAFGQTWNSIAGVSLNQALFDQSVFTGLKAAKSTREFYQINEQLTEEQVIERVANAYYQVYVQQQKLVVVDNNLKTTNKIKNIIKGQYDNGLARKIDLDRITVRVNNINSMRQQIVNAIALQENALKFYIGMPMENAIVIPKTAFEVTPQDLIANTDVTNRTEFLLLKKQEQLLMLQKKSFQASYYPTLSLIGSYNYIGQGPQMPFFAKPADGVYWSDFATIGLNLRVPIFSGFGNKARVKQAENSIKSLQVDMDETKLALSLALENAKKQIENSLITIANQKENAQLAQEVLNNTNNNYAQGLASLTDLLDAENALVEAQNNYTAAILEYKLAEIQFIKSKGELKSLIK
ncbi:TolC family protein [Flavobacterium difficile]|uniref:TolC family protein n=1 Tax=Flavobacterium difficile TaxID=2709659 RepID=A0ABX0I777_9FLAO|nr:TolC family protein [Flavobacterium difficile]NHM03030.1 TolC family protein [Flavobacterium difficile]